MIRVIRTRDINYAPKYRYSRGKIKTSLIHDRFMMRDELISVK